MDVHALRDVLDRMGVERTSIKGGEVVALCPFHEEGTPSFCVNPRRGSICFGCGRKHGSVQSLLDELSRKTGVSHFSPMSWLEVNDVFDFTFTKKVVGPSSESILRYYEPNVEYFVKNWNISEEVAVRRSPRLDPYNGKEVFPLYDDESQFWGFVERSKGPTRSVYRYPPGLPRKNILIGGNDTNKREVWVVEGVRDLCRVETLVPGARAVALGTCRMSNEQARKLHRFGRIILCLDNDGPGQDGTRDALKRLPLKDTYLAEYEGKDPGETSGFEVHHSVW